MKSVFFISDRTGITTEGLGNALLTQFEGVEYRKELIPFVDSVAKADKAILRITARYEQEGERPIVLTSVLDSEIRDKFKLDFVFHVDFFESFVPKLEDAFGQKSSLVVGKSHGMGDTNKYNNRIDAIHFSLDNDDGNTCKNYAEADVILVGVSRVGKTPTCVFLAVNYGIKAANYPLAELDLKNEILPKQLVTYHSKLFGLTIEPDILHSVRTHRLPNTRYADLKNCNIEVAAAERIMQNCGVPFLNVSKKSIEEISVGIMQQIKLKRKF